MLPQPRLLKISVCQAKQSSTNEELTLDIDIIDKRVPPPGQLGESRKRLGVGNRFKPPAAAADLNRVGKNRDADKQRFRPAAPASDLNKVGKARDANKDGLIFSP